MRESHKKLQFSLKIIIGQTLNECLELAEETHVVLEIIPQVLDLPLEHGDTLYTHSESESAVLLAVYTGSLQDIRIHHTAAHDLKPACTLAYVTTLSVADIAAHIDFCRRLREREIGRSHPDLALRSEHLAGKQKNSLLHIGERHVFIYIKPLYLMENTVGTR